MENQNQGPPPAYQDVTNLPTSSPNPQQKFDKKIHPQTHPHVQQQQQQHYAHEPPHYMQEAPLHYQYIGNVGETSYNHYGPYVPNQRIVMEPPPPNHALLAWFTCLCCCWPIGIIAVIKSLDVNSSLSSGDIVRAKESSKKAFKFSIIALTCGIFCSVFWFIIWIYIARESHSHSHSHPLHRYI